MRQKETCAGRNHGVELAQLGYGGECVLYDEVAQYAEAGRVVDQIKEALLTGDENRFVQALTRDSTVLDLPAVRRRTVDYRNDVAPPPPGDHEPSTAFSLN